MFNPGRDVTVEVEGRSWTISRITPAIILAFRDWIEERLDDPYVHLERFIDKLPAADVVALMKEVRAEEEQLRCFSMQSAICRRWMQTEPGIAELFRLLLSPKHPGVSTSDAFQVAMALEESGEKDNALDTAHGQLESEKNSLARQVA